MRKAAERVVDDLQKKFGVDPRKLVCIGQSLGAGPATHVATIY